MGLLKRIFYKDDGLPNKIGKPIHNILKPKKDRYIGECLLKYHGTPVSKFKTNENAFNSKEAEKKLREGLTIHVVKVYKDKSKKNKKKKNSSIDKASLQVLKGIKEDLNSGKLKESELDSETKLLLHKHRNEIHKSNS